jgi:glutaredoxin
MKRQIEIFTAGCPVCEPVVTMVKEEACDSCDITIHNLSEDFDNAQVRDKIKSYGVNRIPVVVVDGVLLGCCTNNEVSREELIKAGVGQPLA